MKDLQFFVKNIAKESIRKKGFASAAIIFDWPLIVGEELAKYTTPVKVHFPAQKNSGGSLHIEVEHAQALFVQQMEPQIVERIATYFGYKAVDKIKLLHVNNNKPLETEKKIEVPQTEVEKLDKLADEIEDSELREKLKSIGRHMLDRKHS